MTQPSGRRRWLFMTTVLVAAALSLVLSAAGLVVSVLALGRSDRATTLATAANDRADLPDPSDAPPPPPAPTSAPIDDTPAPQPTAEINPLAEFKIAYEGQHLRVQSRACTYSDRTTVDLDEPRVVGIGDNDRSDIGYAGCSPGSIHTDLAFAEVPGPDATPADCLETIRTAPGRAPIAPARGMTLCTVTSQNNAAAQGITQKLVFITVDSITTDSGTGVLTVTLKAWNVPQ